LPDDSARIKRALSLRDPAMTPRSAPSAGFTLVELVVVLMLVGILGAVAGPRFFNLADYQARRYADQLQAGLRHAQAVAIATRGKVQVDIDTAAPAARIAADCTAAGTAVRSPDGSGQVIPTPPSSGTQLAVTGQTLPLKLCFNALGQPLFATSAAGTAVTTVLTVTVSGGSTNLSFQLEPDTGFIH
jgi:MSHA pilin protein MshC